MDTQKFTVIRADYTAPSKCHKPYLFLVRQPGCTNTNYTQCDTAGHLHCQPTHTHRYAMIYAEFNADSHRLIQRAVSQRTAGRRRMEGDAR